MFNAEKIKNDIIKWIAGYFENNAPPETKAVVAISGGKDSSVVAALCVAALGKDRVFGVLLPCGEQFDIDVSYDLCEFLGISYVEINIAAPVSDLYEKITEAGLTLNDVARFNTPARIRMTALYALSGIVGGRVANTSNLSEDYVGYSTKFGDSAGDFAPLADLTVTEVKAVGRALGLDSKFIDKTPIDGLCGLSDEENLGFTYEVLDRYIREGFCEDEKVRAKIDKLRAANLHKVNPMPKFVLDFGGFN